MCLLRACSVQAQSLLRIMSWLRTRLQRRGKGKTFYLPTPLLPGLQRTHLDLCQPFGWQEPKWVQAGGILALPSISTPAPSVGPDCCPDQSSKHPLSQAIVWSGRGSKCHWDWLHWQPWTRCHCSGCPTSALGPLCWQNSSSVSANFGP